MHLKVRSTLLSVLLIAGCSGDGGSQPEAAKSNSVVNPHGDFVTRDDFQGAAGKEKFDVNCVATAIQPAKLDAAKVVPGYKQTIREERLYHGSVERSQEYQLEVVEVQNSPDLLLSVKRNILKGTVLNSENEKPVINQKTCRYSAADALSTQSLVCEASELVGPPLKKDTKVHDCTLTAKPETLKHQWFVGEYKFKSGKSIPAEAVTLTYTATGRCEEVAAALSLTAAAPAETKDLEYKVEETLVLSSDVPGLLHQACGKGVIQKIKFLNTGGSTAEIFTEVVEY